MRSTLLFFVILYPFIMGAGASDAPSPVKQPKKTLSIDEKIQEVQAIIDAGRYKTAIKKGLALGKKSKDARAYNLVGYSYRKLNKHKRAIKAYRIALKIDPKLSIAKEYLAVAYLNIGKINRARKIYKLLKTESPSLAKSLKFEADKIGITL